MSDEGEDASPRPKRKIKKVMVSSASSSDSDDSGPTTSTRRKRLRVLSEDGGFSDSSSGSWAMGAIRRRRALPGLRDSDDDSSGWATDHSDAPWAGAIEPSTSTASISPSNNVAKAVSGFCSDSSEGNSEKCSICLMKFLNQEVGTPQNCEHIFCLDCITEWSRNMNTCPVDRITFDSIVVRACAGGRVLRTEVVKVTERRPSLEMMIIEDPTVCEVCHNADREESMLLCDGCDHGFHMQCLTPPLTRIPEDQWLCTYCAGVWRSAVLENLDRAYRASSSADEPSTSSGRRRASAAAPAGSRTQRARPAPRAAPRAASARGSAAGAARRAATTPRTRKRKYRRKTRKAKRRQPRTAARRTHVLASVRAKLAAVRRREGAGGAGDAHELSARRAGAGIPALSLFGSAHQLEYFEEQEEPGAGAAAAAVVASRPTSAILSAYRQARRKMISIPSPSHASCAPDLLSDILASQARLHSKRGVVSVAVDGAVAITLETRGPERRPDAPLAGGAEGARQAPAYPGQGRGWGGGYRYPREQNNHHQTQNQNQGYARGGGGAGHDNGFGGPPRAPAGGFDRRDDNNGQFNDYDNRRLHHYANEDEPWHDRNRRQPDQNRGPTNQRNEDRRFSGGGPAWRLHRPAGPPQRQSFGGFENPLDMRMGPSPALPGAGPRPTYSCAAPTFPSEPEKPPPPAPAYRPLPLPPSFELVAAAARTAERDEDDRSDEGLIIDTEKYDPTEPTNDDDDSGEDDDAARALPPPAADVEPAPEPEPECRATPSVESILAGISSSGLQVPAGVLDSAVRAALEEHRALRAPARRADAGDCPNFSIYSATSVHLAADAARAPPSPPPAPPAPARRDSLEDLVQGDGDPSPPATPPAPPAPADPPALLEYKAKLSKRCPITTNTRNPITIRLHTPALIRRHAALYDDEDDVHGQQESEPSREPADPAPHGAALNEDKLPSEPEPEPEPEDEEIPTPDDENEDSREPKKAEAEVEAEVEMSPPHVTDEEATPERALRRDNKEQLDDDDRTDDELGPDDDDAEDKDKSESEESASSRSASGAASAALGAAAGAAKMTESISETEDERSYTPCLDERAPAPPPAPADGLGTELISEEDMFSEGSPAAAAAASAAAPPEDGEILDQRPRDDAKRKRRKAKKEGRGKGRKRADVAFKKLSKGKERNYRERDKDKARRRSASSSASRDRRRRKDKRKDLERYDVRTLVSERRRRAKDAFGRDVSPSASEPSPPRARLASASPRRARFSSTSPRRARLSSVSPRRARLSSVSPRRARLSSASPRRARLSSASPRRARLSSASPRRARLSSTSPRRARLSSTSPRRARLSSASPRRARLSSASPRRARLSSASPRRARLSSASPRRARLSTASPRRARLPSPSPRRARLASGSPRRARLTSGSPRRGRLVSASPRRAPSSASARRSPTPAKRRRKRSGSRAKAARRRRSTSKVRKRRRASASPATSPKPTKKKKKRIRSSCAGSPPAARRRSPRRKRARRRLSPAAPAPPAGWSPPRAPSPRTPPPAAPLPMEERRRRRDMERAHRRLRDAAGPSKEVFTSGDNILVSVSFKEQESAGRRARRGARRRGVRGAAPAAGAKPVAIIDLERSPFRELTPSPKHVIVLSDDEAAPSPSPAAPPAPRAPSPPAAPPPPPAHAGPKTPPERAQPAPAAAAEPEPTKPAPEGAEGRGPLTPPEPPDSPDAYDPYEPTRSASGSPAPPAGDAAPPPAAPPDRPSMTLEAAQKTNLSADEVLDRRPLSPIEKVLALLQSTRDESPEAVVARAAGPPAGAPPSPPAALTVAPPAPLSHRVQLPDAQARVPPKLFLAKPSPIKSDPIKPMPQATKLSRLPLPLPLPLPGVVGVRRRSLSPAAEGGASPYSPGSSDFGDLFEPPPPYKRAHKRNHKSKHKNRGKTTVDVKLDDDNLQILDELPSSAVEMQVKSKFLKKLNRQERVVEEVKLVLKPHYNKKHVSKDEYKHILRRAVPKICHNKTGEINPMKIQSLVEAYVKKFRKKRKLGQ